MNVRAGAYTSILGIYAPSSAVPGIVVNVTVTIKNISSSLMEVMVGGALEYGVIPWPSIDFPSFIKDVNPRDSRSFVGSFIMPEKDVIIHAYSYYRGLGEVSFSFDDHRTEKVAMGVLEPIFSNLSVIYARG